MVLFSWLWPLSPGPSGLSLAPVACHRTHLLLTLATLAFCFPWKQQPYSFPSQGLFMCGFHCQEGSPKKVLLGSPLYSTQFSAQMSPAEGAVPWSPRLKESLTFHSVCKLTHSTLLCPSYHTAVPEVASCLWIYFLLFSHNILFIVRVGTFGVFLSISSSKKKKHAWKSRHPIHVYK